jgi:glycosyltransferase involved in cell wall biosynthesis
MINVLMLSKACLVGTYQTKLEAIAAHDDINLTVMVPPVWQDPAGPVQLERVYTQGYQLLVEPIRFNGQYHLFYFPTLKKRLAALKPDVVHIDEEPYNLATWLAMRQARAVGAKTLFFSWQNINRRYPPPFRWMEQQVLGGVDAAIVGNRDAAHVWQVKGYRGRLAVIPQFGVDPVLFQPPARRDPGRSFTFGVANRRLVPEKGVDLLLRALAQVPGVWRLLVAGEGPERPYLQQLAAQLGIADRVQFDGAVGSDRMPAFLQELDVLVLPSRTLPNWKEQFGRVLIEAMACEVAVVGSDSGEIPHVIGDAGLVFPEDDEAALAAHLQVLMTSETLRQTLGKKGRERVLAQYTQAQIAAQTVALYRDMMAK